MNNDDIKLLLVKYITSQASEAEAKEVKHWIGLHPENELYFIELYETWQNMLYLKPETIDEEKAYNLFSDKIAPKKQTGKRSLLLMAAAVLLIFLVSSALFVYLRQPVAGGNLQLVAKNGSVKKIVLTDGTIVWLNAGSTLHYDAGFGKTNRTVYLEGEAFFDIGHPKNKIAFLVNTRNYIIRDIGTKFNLKAYPDDPYFETTVIKGEVAVEGNTDHANRIYVKPHQVLKIYYGPEKDDKKEAIVSQKSYNEVHVSQIDSAKTQIYDGWKDDLLIFDGSTLTEISKVLERRYDVKIAIEGLTLQNIKYSGSFKSVPNIEEVLHLIKQNTPINYTIDGQKITITQTN